MVVERAGGGEQPVGLAVVDGEVVGEGLGRGVRRARVVRGVLGLRLLVGDAEHLRAGGLEEAWRPAVPVAEADELLEHPQHGHAVGLGDGLGGAPGGADGGEAGEVVDLVGAQPLEHGGPALVVALVEVDQRHAVEVGVGPAEGGGSPA